MGRERVNCLKKEEFCLKGKKCITQDCECICEIIDTFICCDIEKWEFISYCYEGRLIVKGNVYIKVHYIADYDCKPVMTKKCVVPFHEIFPVDDTKAIGNLECCILYSDIELCSPYSIQYVFFMSLIWNEYLQHS